MKTGVKIGIAAAGAAAAFAGITAYLIAPEKPKKGKTADFLGRNFAHRGLHKKDKSVPENSLAAFATAVEAGYGIELDVRLCADGKVAVFHDDNLERMCGRQGCIEILTWEEVKELRLNGTSEGVPALRDVMDIVGGRVPLIIEIKRGPRNRELCARTLDEIRAYGGLVCVESFDPSIVRWFRKHAPDILRGQLTGSMNAFEGDLSGFISFFLSRVLLNFISRPNFIAHSMGKKSLTVRLSEAMGAMKVCWTSHSEEAEKSNDAVIFEYYRPGIRFK